MNKSQAFLNRLVDLRKRCGISQVAIAQQLGIAPSTLCEQERSGRMTLETALKYAEAVGLHPEAWIIHTGISIPKIINLHDLLLNEIARADVERYIIELGIQNMPGKTFKIYLLANEEK